MNTPRSGAGRPAPSRTTPIPPGTRDVLPDEMRELRAICGRMRATFEDAGYGEVHTPALEYEDVLRPAGARPAYRVVDDHGDVLVLRSDMTVPIARVAATRYTNVEPPLRFSYLAHAYRGVRPQRGRVHLAVAEPVEHPAQLLGDRAQLPHLVGQHVAGP